MREEVDDALQYAERTEPRAEEASDERRQQEDGEEEERRRRLEAQGLRRWQPVERAADGGQGQKRHEAQERLLHFATSWFFSESIHSSIAAISRGMSIDCGQCGVQRPHPVQWSARRSSSGTAFT